MSKITKRVLIIAGSLLAAACLAGVLVLTIQPLHQNVRGTAQTVLAHLYRSPTEQFPAIDVSRLTATQQKIVALTRQEYNKKPVSFDAAVLAYTQGNKEEWCSDFASWIMKQAGVSFSNPNSGSWRIPGVGTLQQYFMEQHRYVLAGNYTPKVGDVAIYLDGNSHTNIVIAVHGNTMTTVGGNETGHVRIETQTFTDGSGGLSGFGELPTGNSGDTARL